MFIIGVPAMFQNFRRRLEKNLGLRDAKSPENKPSSHYSQLMLLRIWDQAKIFEDLCVSRNHSILLLILFCRAYLCPMSYTDHSSLKRKEMANDNPIKWRKILPCRSTCQVIFCTCLSALIHMHMYHQIISGKDLTSTLTRGLRF